MRILLTADPELPVPPKTYGGIERIVADLVQGLVDRGHDVGLVAHRDSTAPAHKFYPWPGAASQRLGDSLRNSWTLRRAAQDFRPDVLHSFSRLLYLFPVLPMGVPMVMSYQREPSGRTTRWTRRLARGRLRFTGCSAHICASGRRRGGGEWSAIPNFVDLNKYTFREAVPDDAPLVFLSRVEAIKGTHLAIEAAKRAGRRLVIAGNHADDGANGTYWREQVVPHLGKDGIDYVGPVDDRQKNELLGRALAMLVPVQWEEPFGIVFVEALACGTPVISTRRGALPEIVRDGVDGFLGDTVEDWAAAVGNVSTLRRADCRGRVEDAFSANVVVAQYEALYRQVVTPQRTAEGIPA